MAYATLSEVKAYKFAGGATVPTTDDTLISALIVRAQAAIDRFTGRTFEASTSTKTFDLPCRKPRLLEFNTDCLTVTTLTNGDGQTIASTEYNLLPLNSTPKYALEIKAASTERFESDTSGNTRGVISVAGTWGYSTAVPDDVKHATIRLVVWMYQQKDTAAEGDRPILAGENIIMPSRMPQDVVEMLRPYRNKL